MEFHQFGADTDPDLLFVLGWGNQPTHAPVRWLIDRLAEAGWHVHTATIPVHITDVQREWVRPVERYADDLGRVPVLAHSAGGLTVAHADIDAETVTYLSPFWGFAPTSGGPLISLLARLPTDRRIIPRGGGDTDSLGEYGTEQQLADGADRISPAFLSTTARAHRTLPPIREDAVGFCSLTDDIVSTRAIGEHLPSDRIVLYDGGHELFSSGSREAHLDTLFAAIEDGAAAVKE
ncbi:alpha/beta fold hydrolase [Natronomonas sp. EA1]|uniref:alpha/beta fold hydrolase n=1 Tax=Natronomonas sp. EA1 TaxID=3421655 RepID=UPI003EB81A3A